MCVCVCVFIFYLRNVHQSYSLERNKRSYIEEYTEIPQIYSRKKYNFRDG